MEKIDLGEFEWLRSFTGSSEATGRRTAPARAPRSFPEAMTAVDPKSVELRYLEKMVGVAQQVMLGVSTWTGSPAGSCRSG